MRGEERIGEELGGAQGGDTIIRTYYVREESFQLKKKKTDASSAVLLIYLQSLIKVSVMMMNQ